MATNLDIRKSHLLSAPATIRREEIVNSIMRGTYLVANAPMCRTPEVGNSRLSRNKD